MKAFASAQFARFLVTGGIAALVNYGSRFAWSQWFALPVAVVLAYLCGMATAWWLARRYVFTGSTRSTASSIGWFTLVNLAAVLQTLAVTLVLARWLLPAAGVTRHAEALAHAAGVLVPVFTSFLGHRRWSFR